MSQMKNGRRYIACGVGICAMILLTVAMVLILPIFILNEYLTMEYTKGIIIILMGVVAFAGALVVRIIAGKEAACVSAISVGIYYILVIFVSVFFYDGLTLRTLYELLSIAAGYFAALMLMVKWEKPHNKRAKLRRNR